MILVIRILNRSSSVLVSPFFALRIGFVIKILVLGRFSQLISSNQDSCIMRLFVNIDFYYFCLEFSPSLALAMALKIRPDQDFGVPDCLVSGSLVVALSLLSEKLSS